jgi:hypothetical protein
MVQARSNKEEHVPRDNLNVLLPRNRNHAGWIRVEIEGKPQQEFHALGSGSTTVKGKSVSKHPSLSPFAHAGNTPTGDYVSPGVVDSRDWDLNSYGPWGAIRLKALAGDALLAQDVFGRKGLLIHGGPPGRFDGYRSTLGCHRLRDDDMRQLIQLISGAGNNAQARSCENVSVKVTVRE